MLYKLIFSIIIMMMMMMIIIIAPGDEVGREHLRISRVHASSKRLTCLSCSLNAGENKEKEWRCMNTCKERKERLK